MRFVAELSVSYKKNEGVFIPLFSGLFRAVLNFNQNPAPEKCEAGKINTCTTF
jgi:hypothetical protein